MTPFVFSGLFTVGDKFWCSDEPVGHRDGLIEKRPDERGMAARALRHRDQVVRRQAPTDLHVKFGRKPVHVDESSTRSYGVFQSPFNIMMRKWFH